jgi:hypothetical protein
MTALTLDTRLGKAARGFVEKHPQLLIGGKLVAAASGKTFAV